MAGRAEVERKVVSYLDALKIAYERTRSGPLQVDAGSTAVYISAEEVQGQRVVCLLARG